MKKLFELCKGKLVRLNDTVVGIVCGYTDSYFIILLEEGTIAENLGLDVVYKNASDIFGKFVGETEQNIRRAFEESTETQALLISVL
jgi:hypothetical protein